MLADGSATGKVDPAFEAHAGPIGHWAQAVWNSWLPASQLLQLVTEARVKVSRATQPWSVVYGPAAALVCTAARLQWTVCDATNIVTDEGRTLKLNLHPPVVVVREVCEAVRMCRWRAIEDAHHSLSSAGSGRGAVMEPIWKLLKSCENTATWNQSLRGSLRSAIANRQWPQARCYKAGFAGHSKCMFCVHGSINDTAGDGRAAPATDDRISENLQSVAAHGGGAVCGAVQAVGQPVQHAAPATDHLISGNMHSVAANGVGAVRRAAQRPTTMPVGQTPLPLPLHGLMTDPAGDSAGTSQLLTDTSASASAPLNRTHSGVAISQAPVPPPTLDQVDGSPVETGFHRVWRCPRLDVQRRRYAPGAMLARAAIQDWAGDVCFERARKKPAFQKFIEYGATPSIL